VSWWRRFGALGAVMLAMLIVVAGCQPSASASGSPDGSAEASRNAGTGEASLDAPDEVEAGADFEVSWTGPDGQGDYITVVAEGTTEWTNEPYFYTANGPTGTLVVSTDGDYEIWYVAGSDGTVFATRPITVTPYHITLQAPTAVDAGAEFDVEWTGPDGPGDYITIVPAGSPEGTYFSYAYTAAGSPATITAGTETGDYEVRYIAGTGDTLASSDIVVR